jgi:hypothetical protein
MRAAVRGVWVVALALVGVLATDAAQAQVVQRVFGAPTNVSEVASDVRVDGTGRLVIVGAREGGGRAIGRLIVRRRMPDGAADVSFGRRGVRVLHAISGGTGFAVGPMALWRRHVVVAGETNAGEGFEACWVVRLKADGRRDTAFGRDGVVRFGPAKNFPLVRALVVGGGGTVYVAGDCGSEGVVKLQADGRPDLGFGAGGLAASPFPDGIGVSAIRLLGRGRLLVVGNNETGFETVHSASSTHASPTTVE